jgi:KDO2-lipid IV(A) lauroyltransferase
MTAAAGASEPTGDEQGSGERGIGKAARDRILVGGYRLAAWAGPRIPEGPGRVAARTLGRLIHARSVDQRAVVAANQAQVLGRAPDDPQVRAATREAFERYARYWFDSFHAPGLSDEEVRRRFVVEHGHRFLDAVEAGRGVILALPHMGNWDVAGRWLTAIGVSCLAVAERLDPPELYHLFLAHRRRLGMDVVGLGDTPGLGGTIRSALAQGGVVALVADRDLTATGIEVEMFGRARRLPAGPALLALTTGAALIVSPVYQTERDWRCVMSEPLVIEQSGDRRADVLALTRVLAHEFERAIAAMPPDWHMFQPAWPPIP